MTKKRLRAAAYVREEITGLVPTWCADLGEPRLFVADISAAERQAYRDSLQTFTYDDRGKLHVEASGQNAAARLLVKCVVNEAGGRVFGEDDADMVGEQPAHLTELLYALALRVTRQRKQDLEELEKNLAGKGRASSVGSPDTSAGDAASPGACGG